MPPLDAYQFHGVSFRKNSDGSPKLEGKNAKGECPFCGKEDHFFVQAETGQFNCRRCSAEGNLFTFFKLLLEAGDQKTTGKSEGQLGKLADTRGISLAAFREWGLVTSPLEAGVYLLPIFNVKGKIANVGRIIQIASKWKVYGTPGCKLYPFGLDRLKKAHTTLWVCEGPWDGMALSAALATHRVTDDGRWIMHSGKSAASHTQAVIAVPGAGTFNAEWLELFAGRDVRLVYDNDYPQDTPSGKKIMPGWDGQKRVLKLAEEHGHSATALRYLVWGKGGCDLNRPDGYDVRDLIREAGPTVALSYLCSKLETPKTSSPEKSNGQHHPESIEPLHCESFADLCGHFKEHLHFTTDMRACLAITLAVVASTNLGGEQLWFRLIGPPGSGKTTLAECLSVAREFCFPKSILTGFHSGFNNPRMGGPKKESSLIPEMDGKCVIIKDADTLLNSSQRDRILAELRDIYDGVTRSHYRTGKRSDYENLRNTFILCGTDSLRSLNRSFLGERFLDCDILGGSSTGEYLDSAMSSAFQTVATGFLPEKERVSEAKGAGKQLLKQYTYGFLRHLIGRIQSGEIQAPSAGPLIGPQLKAMAQLLSLTRARVERDKEGIMYRPRADLGTRVIGQFVKLASCLAIVLDRSAIDKPIMDIVAKVLWDSAHGYPLEIMAHLFSHPNGRTREGIVQHLELSEEQTRRILNDMLEIGTLTRNSVSNKAGFAGRDAYKWHLTNEVRELYRLSNLSHLTPAR